MGRSPDEIRELIRKKLRGWDVPDEDIATLFGAEYKFAFWVKSMEAFANLPSEFILPVEQKHRREDIQKYIDQLEILSAICEDDSLPSRMGWNKDEILKEADNLADDLEGKKKGRSSPKRFFLKIAQHVLLVLIGIDLRTGQRIDFMYEFLKDTAEFDRIGEEDFEGEHADQAKDQIRKWDEEALKIMKGHSIKSN